MIRICFIILAVTIVTTALCSGVAHCNRLNPYLPQNAIAAEPESPYNLNFIPCKSPVRYQPYPARIPGSHLLPDIPPMCEPVAGPFGVPVPVP
jgi:energy-converting hydrogenase Eha subunit F